MTKRNSLIEASKKTDTTRARRTTNHQMLELKTFRLNSSIKLQMDCDQLSEFISYLKNILEQE